jgi:lactate permease
MSTWWGLLPFLVLFGALTVFRQRLLFSSCLFLLTATGQATLVWLVHPNVLLGSWAKGLMVSLDIALIIIGSLFFLDTLKKIRVLSSLEHYLHRLTPDSRVQALMLVWFFGALLEGAAGFGTPAAVVAPLLVHLGFAPLTAATLSLVGNTVPVSFGAVGTPVRVGFDGLPTDQLLPLILPIGFALALLVPLLLVWVLRHSLSVRSGIVGPHGQAHQAGDGNGRPSSMIPFALWSGSAFAVPYLIAGQLNPEIPTLAGALGGLTLTLTAATHRTWRRIFLPSITQRLSSFDPNESPLTLPHTLLPYFLMVAGLLAGRAFLPRYTLTLPGEILHTVSAYNPGLILIFLAAGYAYIGNLNRAELTHSAQRIVRQMFRTAATISVLVAGAQLLLHSAENASGLPGMLHGFTQLLYRENITVISPLLGFAGAMVSGSVTASNLMFSQLQWDAAAALGTSGVLALCLQLYGATAGNAVALVNISAVEGALNIRQQIRPLLLRLIGPVGLYMVAIVLLGAVAPIFLSFR